MTEMHVRSDAAPHPSIPLQRMLVAFDGSAPANRALEFALALGRGCGTELLLCNAVDHAAVISELSRIEGSRPRVDDALIEVDEAAAKTLSDATARAAAAGVRCSSALLDGRSVPAIVACAKERGAGAIFIGTQGKRGLERVFRGSTAEGVIRAASMPVFVVHADAKIGGAARGLRRVLVALDDSDRSDAAMQFALELAVANGSVLICCTALETADLFDKASAYGYDPTPFLNEMYASASELVEAKARGAAERGLTAQSIVVEGHAAGAILKAAADNEADLIAIGTHGRRGLRRLFMGSVAENLVRRSTLPVAVVREFHV